MNITRENIDDLNAVLKVDIAKEDYSDKVEKILKDYRRTANIPGFRKGHVPMGMVKKQYGRAVVVDEVNKLLQDTLNNYLTEEKLDVLGNPLPREQDDLDWDSDSLSFEFELGLAPKFEVNLTERPVAHYKIVADDKMIEGQVERIQKQYGKLISKDTVDEGDQLRGTFKNEAEGINYTTNLPLEKINGKANQKKFVGAKVGDVISLKTKGLFEDDHMLMDFLQVEHDKAHGMDIEVDFTIEEINVQELAELDQELFDKVFGEGEVKSVTDMKNKIKEDAAKQFEQQSDQQLLNDVTEMLIETTTFDLPKEFLQKWIRTAGENPMTEEEAREEYEKSEKGIKYQLIESKIIEDNNISIEFKDLKEMARDRVKTQMAQFGQFDPEDKDIDDIVMRVLSNQEEVKRLQEQMMSEKMLDIFKEKAKLEEKEMTYDEFVKEVFE